MLRTITTYLLTMLCLVAVCAQDSSTESLNQTVDGKKEGLWRTKGQGGSTDEGMYVNGRKDGEWTNTDAKGNLRARVTFVNGVANGPAVYYHADGTVMEQGIWKRDHWEGSYERFYANGNKACSFVYNKDGQRTGRQTYYHENGVVMFDGNWTDGEINGTLSIYNEEGRKIMERNYDDSGNMQSINAIMDAPVDDNKPKKVFSATGNFTLFDAAGRKEQSGRFVEGKLIDGEHYYYDANGKLSRTDIIKGGQVAGTKTK